MMARWLPCIACIASLIATACAGSLRSGDGLDLHFQASTQAFRDIAQRATETTTRDANDAKPVIVAISQTATPALVGITVDGRQLWSEPTTAQATLLRSGDVVATLEDGTLRVRDLRSGTLRFDHDLEGMNLLGIAQRGEHFVVVASAPSVTRVDPVSRLVTLNATSGSLRWERTVQAAIGAPVIANDVLFVPWNRQGISAIDLNNGRELARTEAGRSGVARSSVAQSSVARSSVDWLANSDAGVIYGDRLVRDLRCVDAADDTQPDQATASCNALPSPFTQAPTQPPLMFSSYRAPLATATGIHTAFALTRETQHGALQLGSDRAYLVFYRYVFAFDHTGALIWARALANDVLHAHATTNALLVLDTAGASTWLDATDGLMLSRTVAGVGWRSAAIGGAPHAPSRPTVATDVLPTLSRSLLEVALDTDNRLVVARAFAVEQLARAEAPEATQQLLDVYEQRATPAGLRSVVAKALLSRRTGADFLIGALDRHADFLEAATAAPLAVVVPALVAMNERRAVVALVEHLRDPATSGDDVAVIADALAVLGDRTLAPWLVAWLERYRASSALASHPAAVTSLAKAVARLGAVADIAKLRALTEHASTQPVFAAAVTQALHPHEAPTPADQAVADASPAATKAKFNTRDVNAAFAPHVDALRACIVAARSHNQSLAQLRISFVARHDGSTLGFASAPSTSQLDRCLAPITNAIRLPAFEGKALIASYVIQLRASMPTTADATNTDTAQSTDIKATEWWSPYARETPPSDGAPWWQRYVENDFEWLSALYPTPPTVTATAAPSEATPTLPAPPAPQTSTAPATTPPAAATPPAPPQPAPTQPAEDAWWLPSQP